MPAKLEEPFTPEQAADMLGINVSTLYKAIKRNEIEGFYVGDKKSGIRIDQSEVRRYKRTFSTSTFKLKSHFP